MEINMQFAKFCPYCGEPLNECCLCAEEIAEAEANFIEEIEERQHQSGFYAFQDQMAMFRYER